MFNRRRDDHNDTTTTTTTTTTTAQQQQQQQQSTLLFGRPIQNSIRPPQKIQQRITRQEHYDSYINNPQLAPSTRKMSDDDSTFDTVFQSVTGDTLILRVHWPPTTSGMIARPPAMTLAGVEARHPWLDQRMCIVGYDPIQTSEAWTNANVHLGVAVHTVIQHLQLNPPTIIRFVDSGLSAIQTKKPSHHHHQQQPGSHQNQNHSSPPPPPAYHDSMVQKSTTTVGKQRGYPSSTANIPNIDWPTIPLQFKELDKLSRERLEELIQNELEFRTFTNQLDIIQQYNTIQQQQLNKNVSVAKANLQYETNIQELYTNITATQQELQSKVQEFQQIYEQQQDQLIQPPAKSKIIQQLIKAKKEAYTQSEMIAEQWLNVEDDGNSTTQQPPTSFIDEFMTVRKLQHVRAAKLELLQRNHGVL